VAYYVYMVRCADGSLYTGSTNDVQRRVAVHNAGKGAKYTRSRLPVELAWWAPCADRGEALHQEWVIKHLTRQEKLALVAAAQSGNPALPE
jgi:pyrroline-5-carboxylate reductase